MQTITIGAYKQTNYVFTPATRTITVYDLFDTVLDFNSLALLTLQRNGGSVPLYAPSLSTIVSILQNSASTTIVAATPTSGGAITAGLHSYFITNIINSSESLPSSRSNTIDTTTNKTSVLTIPIGQTGTTARNIYRTLANDATTGIGYLVATIIDNSSVTYTDSLADVSTNQTVPTTSTIFDIVYSTASPLQIGDTLVIEVRNTDQTYDYDFGVQKTINQVMSELPPADTEVSTITDTNLTSGSTYFYELPQSLWRNCIAQIKATCSTTPSTIKIYATLDPSAVLPATNGSVSVDWADLTYTIFGSNQLYIQTSGTYISPIINLAIDNNGFQVMYDRFLVSYQVLNSVNFLNINIRKF